MKIQIRNIIVLLTILGQGHLLAQKQLNKEVQVVKDYIPSVSDANKINKLPEINDTIIVKPAFTYNISPKPVKTYFKTEPLKAAKMVGEPLSDLYGKYIKAGIGNYFTPIIIASIHNLRSKEYSFGAYYKHLSSAGKIKLQNNKKVFAGYFDEQLTAYGKKFYKNAFFSSDIGFEGYGRHYYGYNPDVDTILNKNKIKKRMFGVNFNSQIKSNYTDSLHLNYNLQLNYFYFTDNYENFENNYTIKGQFNKFYNTDNFGGDVIINYVDNSFILDSSDIFNFKLSPWIGKNSTRWQVKAGLNIVYNSYADESGILFYPVALLQYNIVNNYAVPYAGIDGGLNNNNLKSIALENPFYNKNIQLSQTDIKFRLYGGIKGNINNITSFNIRGSYSSIDNMYFFTNDSSSLFNTFGFEYDDVEVKNLFAEFETSPATNFIVGIKGNYYGYKLLKLSKAWHKPKYDFTIWWYYKLQDKIYFNSEIFITGQKYVKNILIQPDEFDVIESVVDLNLSIEYNYTKQISAFIKLNNILGNSYYYWYYYPTQKFNFIVGASYKF